MSTKMEEDVKRRTAKRKAALVVEIMQGKTTMEEASRSSRKLPLQVDNSKLEIPVLNVLGMNSIGVLSPRESWGLNSL